MATNRETSRLHLRKVVYGMALCICIISAGAAARNNIFKISSCPATCNCSQGAGTNKYLALCEGEGGASFTETVRQLPKDITNFTFVLVNTPAQEDYGLIVPKRGELVNLKTLIITSTMQGPFKYTPCSLGADITHLFKLTNLTTLQINIFIHDVDQTLNCSFETLEVFDLSNTRLKSPPSSIYHLLQNTSPGRLRVLNFHFIVAASYPFGQLDFNTLFNSSRQWERLEKFDFSQNGVSSLSPGMYHRLPKLKYIDLSNNVIGTSNNGTKGFLLELFLHPILEVINLSNQKGLEIDRLRARRSYYRTEDKRKDCSMRTHTNHLCSLVNCIYLGIWRGHFACEEIPPGIVDFSSQCWLGTYFPVGKNIREVYLSNFWRMSYQGLFSEFPLAPKYCIHPNNSIEVLDFSHNYFGQIIRKDSNVTEVCLLGLTNLRYFNLQNNEFPFSLSRNCDFPKLEVLLLGGNRMSFHIGQEGILPTMPLLRILDLANNGIENLPILIFSKLFHLQELNLSCNSLTNLELKLPVSGEMRLLNISGNKLTSLPYGFMQQLDNHIANLLTVDMTNNPFMCGCDNIDFVQWVQATKVNVVGREDYLMCSHEHIGQVSIVGVDTDALHKTCNPRFVQIVFGSSSAILLIFSLVLSIFFVYYKRWYLRYKLYLLRRRWKERHQQVSDRDEFLFDAFPCLQQ